eukprot:s714_g14.t1
MQSAAHTLRRKRRVTGINVFQQQKMKGLGFKIGTEDYKQKQKSICEEWNRLTEAEQKRFESIAAEQSATRKQYSSKPLSEQTAADDIGAGNGADGAGNLSSAQRVRLGQQRLDCSLEKLANHKVWKSGLGILSHIGALDPSRVSDIDPAEAAAAIGPDFSYDKIPVANPAENPALHRPCCDVYPGCCRRETHWASVMKCVQQLQTGLENKKAATGCTLLKLVLNCGDSVFRTWHMLGCVSLRPLVHVLGWLTPFQNPDGDRMLVPVYSNKVGPSGSRRWQLHTSHDLFLDIAKQAAENKSLMLVEIEIYKYACVGALDVPNHFVPGEAPKDKFSVGHGVVIPKETVVKEPAPKATKIDLGFGIVFEDVSKRKAPRPSGGASGSGRPAVIDLTEDSDSGKQKAKRKFEPDAATKNRPEPEDFSKLSIEQKVKLLSDESATLLSPEAEKELGEVVEEMARLEKESEVEPAQVPGTTAPMSAKLATGGCRFSAHLGIQDLKVAKRRMCPLDFMMTGVNEERQAIGLESISGYGLRVVRLWSKEFGLPMPRGRLYFIGAELFDANGEPTGNTEATLDRLVSKQCRDNIAHVLTTQLQDPYLTESASVNKFIEYLSHLDTDFEEEDW